MRRQLRAALLCLGAWLTLTAFSSAARAEDAVASHGYALDWVREEGAESCVLHSELSQQLAQSLGRPLVSDSTADRTIQGSIAPGPARAQFTVRLRLLDPSGQPLGERSFVADAAECLDVTESILLVTTLMLDTSTSPVRERPAPAPSPRATEQPAGTNGYGGELALMLAAGLGIQPALEPGASALVRLLTPTPLALELGASYWVRSALPLEGVALGGTVEFDAWSSTLSVCLDAARTADVRFGACAGAIVGMRWADSAALSGTSGAARAFAGPALSVDLRYAFAESWFALAFASAVTTFPRNRFVYTDAEQRERALYEPAPVAAWLGLGLGASVR